MIKEHERVVLTMPVAAEGLEAGDVGTVVHVYRDGVAYEVEFLTLDGHTAAVVTLEASQVRPVSRRDLTHPARYAGQIEGDVMTLTVTGTDTGESVGTFNLTRGGRARLTKCR